MDRPAKVQLEREELWNVREQHAMARRPLLKVGQRTLEVLGRDQKIKAMLLVYDNEKDLIFDDGGNLAGVYEDPPGICREPTADEHDRWDGAGF